MDPAVEELTMIVDCSFKEIPSLAAIPNYRDDKRFSNSRHISRGRKLHGAVFLSFL